MDHHGAAPQKRMRESARACAGVKNNLARDGDIPLSKSVIQFQPTSRHEVVASIQNVAFGRHQCFGVANELAIK
jgi:hypothetical protein